MVKVSVIMPIYQAEEFIERTCTNFSKQTLNDIELICINDGSVDNTQKILEKLAEKYDFIKIIKQSNQGSGIARNNGIKKATGEYIAFLDADDIYIDDDALEKMYNYAKKHDANIVCANLERVSTTMKKEGNFNYDKDNYSKFTEYNILNPEEYGIPWAFYKNIYKRKFLEDNNITFPSLSRGQDPVFLAEALTKTDKIHTTPVTLYGYNHQSNGGANNKVDDYQKKYDYIKHYHDTIKILEDNNYHKTAQKYKDQLIIYISLINNREDQQLLKIIHEIFEDKNPTYFNTPSEEQIYLRICMLNHNDNKAFYNELQTIKKELLEVTLSTTNFIDPKILRKYNMELKKLDNQKQEDLKQLKQLNKKIENSSSWKVTDPLRKSKKGTIKVLKKCKHTLVKLW
ncbi:glycosyltransferase [Methanosphaera cuniculi]|uniref:glycosyltransferase n=1 Tax=Methanosphaera cuniculi TaxID=1077256 RepID=UPI0026EA8CA3|nr:glycosyltransferase [Methanosphaera cuniculi]